MVRIELTTTEAGVLRGILESSLSDLKTERLRTDNRQLRAEEKKQEVFLADLLTRLAE